MLQLNTQVESLDLAGCCIGADSCRWVSELLTNNSAIRMLDLSDNHIGTKGLRHITESMKLNMYVFLSLSCNENLLDFIELIEFVSV